MTCGVFKSKGYNTMNLFKIKDQLKPTHGESLISETPIGNLTFNTCFSEKSLLNFKPISTHLIDDKAILSTWLFDECQIEFLKLNIIPHLPPGMKVTQCLSGIWRLKMLNNRSAAFDFECNLNYIGPNKPRELDIYIEAGEGLAAQTWENPFVRLTIGTEDEDYLQQRASNQDWLPYRFKNLIVDSIDYLKNGIKVSFPEFQENEIAQVHFTVAWTYREIATWFAVDERPKDILKQIAIK